MNVSRRRFIKAITAGVVAPPAFLAPVDGAAALYSRALVIDSLSIEKWDQAGFDAARSSGYTAIHTSLENRNLEAARRDLLDWQSRFAVHSERIMLVTSAQDIRRAKEQEKIGVLLGFQNATCIEGNLGNLDALHRLGARCIQLTYNSRNQLGDGCTERTNAGLSDFGVAVVERMNRLGMIVDLSHCGEQTSIDGIHFSRRPPAFTHTMCKAIYDHPRAKSDSLIRALADKGGVTGIVTLGYFVGPDPGVTVEDYVRHVDHAVSVAGIDHVGLASDYPIRGIEASATRETWYEPRLRTFKPSYRVRWPPWIPELDKPDRFLTVTRALERRGYDSGRIEKLLGLNWVRLFGDVLGG